jgi:DNA mismatch repair protein MSH2
MKDEKELENNETLLVITFKVTQAERLIGAAFINLHERLLMITEFQDNEHYSGLESLVI